MNNLIQLTKAAFLSNFAIGQTKKQKRNFVTTISFVGVLLFVISFVFNYVYSMLFSMEDAMNEYLILMFALAGILSLMLSIFKMQSAIFRTSDYEFLEGLPVSKKTIVASKMLSVYFLTFFEDIIICLPAIIFYGIETLNIYGCIIAFIGMFFVSLIPLLLASIVSFIFALIGSKFKKSNIVTILLYLVMIVGALLISVFMPSDESSLDVNAITQFFNVLPQLWLFYKALSIDKWYYFILFILTNIAAMGAVVLLISSSYSKINALSRYSGSNEKYVGEKVKDSSIEKVLLVKEWKSVTSNAMYFINSFLGPFIGIFIVVVLYVTIENLKLDSTISPSDIKEVTKVFANLIPMLFVFNNTIATSTSASISVEKGNFSSLKSYPLSVKQIIDSKLTIAIIVPVLLNIISIVVAFILFDFHWASIIQIILFPMLACTLNAIVGMLCGLKWAKFDYVNDTQIFKSSMAVGMTMLFDFILSIFIMGAVALNFINPVIGLVVGVILYIVFIGGSLLILRKVQNPWFERLVN